MPRLNGILRLEGALVAVAIGLSLSEVQRLRQAGRPIPAVVSLGALLNTGGECSCVDPKAVATLGLPLKNIGLTNIPAVGGLVPTTQHDASLTVVHPSGDSRLNLVIGDTPWLRCLWPPWVMKSWSAGTCSCGAVFCMTGPAAGSS